VPKVLTREQLGSRKEKAVRFTRDVLGDPEPAEEVADESLEDYAARRKDVGVFGAAGLREKEAGTAAQAEAVAGDLRYETQVSAMSAMIHSAASVRERARKCGECSGALSR